MSDYRVASRYAKSLLELAIEQGRLEEVYRDMQLFGRVCKENRDLVLMLKNPVVKHDKKRSVLAAIFSEKVNQLTSAIFDIITRKNREAILPSVALEFQRQYNLYKSVEMATVTTAVPLNQELKSKLEDIVKEISNLKTVDLAENIDEDIIGGFVLKVGDRQIDDSIKSKLKALELKFSQNPYIKEF